MDAKDFVGNVTLIDELLVRGPYLLYAKRETVNGVPGVVFAFSTDPKVRTERFSSDAGCDLLWNEFTRIMTEQCTPPCMAIKNVLFQPMYLRAIGQIANELAYFVVLDFGNTRNLSLGHRAREEQIATYKTMLCALGLDVSTSDPPTPLQ